jgi:Holliday junction resolvase RusA-like endonuclease
MTKAELFLPWPDRKLSPNARVHWRPLAEAKRKAKQDAYNTVLEAGLKNAASGLVKARYVFSPPDKRSRDADNLVASIKAAQDGLALALGVDDSQWDIVVDHRGPVERHGRVKVELEWGV